MPDHHFAQLGSLALAFLIASCARGNPDAVAGSAATSYDVGVRPRALVVADIDDDDCLDVVVANAGAGTLTVFSGDGEGGLTRWSAVAAGNEPGDVAAIDIDNDDDVDLIVANHETSIVTVLANDGRGTFVPSRSSPLDTGAEPHLHSVAAGDFDGDGWVDIAVESSGTEEVRVSLGGPGGFAAAAPVAVGTMPYYRLGAADVVGDARPEILVPGAGDHTLRILQAIDGRLSAAIDPIACGAAPSMVRAGDVDGDGRTDLVAVLDDGVGIWLAGDSGFHPAPGSPFPIAGATEVAIGDVSGDGVADVAVGAWDDATVTLIAGRTFLVRGVPMCGRPVGLACGDLDRDGRSELLATCATEDRLVVMHWFE